MNTHALKAGEDAAKKSIVELVAMAGLKITVGLFSGMTVIVADGISTLADTLGLFASYIGLHLSRKHSNKNFGYGYYKIETLAALIISIGFLYLSYVMALRAIYIFQNPVQGKFVTFAITASIIALFHSKKLEKRLRTAAVKTNSQSLLANARDKKVDFYAQFAVLASVIANYQNIQYVEASVTLLIAVLIAKEGFVSAKESIYFLLDYWDDPKLTRKIHKIFNKEKDLIVKVKKLRLRRAGTFIFGEAFVEINPYAGIQDLRDELDLLADKIKESSSYIKDFSIYSHISKEQTVKVAVPIKSGRGLGAEVANNFRQTEAYLFATIRNGKIKAHYVKKLPHLDKKLTELTDFFEKEKINILIDNKLSSLVYYQLRRAHHILIYPNFSDIKKVRQTLELLVIDT